VPGLHSLSQHHRYLVSLAPEVRPHLLIPDSFMLPHQPATNGEGRGNMYSPLKPNNALLFSSSSMLDH
jgi:hypothetical protein